MGFRQSPSDEEFKKFDPLAHAVTIIREQHRLVHDGMMFHASKKYTGLVNAGTADILVSVPAGTFPHFQGMVLSFGRGDVDVDVYEGTTTSADGSSISIENINRNSATTPDVTLFDAPTVTDVGTKMHTRWVPPTATGVGLTYSGVITDATGEEWVLKPSTKYLIRITNNSGSTIDWSMEVTWYELGYAQDVL